MREWTKQDIQQALERSAAFRERALLALWKRQTDEEKEQQHTGENNGVGFTKFDAEILTSFANRVLNTHVSVRHGQRLSERQHEVLQRRLPKYWRQLVDVAMRREAEKEANARAGVGHVVDAY